MHNKKGLNLINILNEKLLTCKTCPGASCPRNVDGWMNAISP